MAAIVSPFLLWATIAMIARRRPEVLSHLYPVVRIVTWAGWLSVIAWGAYGPLFQAVQFLQSEYRPLVLYSGISLMYHWMRRRVVPVSNQPKLTEGWWPAPKDKAL